MTSVSSLKPSRYNFAIRVEAGTLLYSAKSGALLQLQGAHHRSLAARLCDSQRIDVEELTEKLAADLIGGGFLVAEECDELSEIRVRYRRARLETPLVITVTTTMDCNLGCYYCYEERSSDRLENADVARLVEHVRRRLAESSSATLHVDWYGGEPLLNADFIEAASPALQSLCDERAVRYSASIISNGTAWPGDAEAFVFRHRIRQVQISFDGLRANHDRRRRFRDSAARGVRSSFDEAVALVDRLTQVVRVDARINIDAGNAGDVLPLVDFMSQRGWFDAPFPVFVQPARLASYSEHSSFLRSHELTAACYDDIRKAVRDRVGSRAVVEESEAPDAYPWPRTSVCAALAVHSDVVGAEGALYRCGLQVGERSRQVGHLSGAAQTTLGSLPVLIVDAGGTDSDDKFWREFDPTRRPNCSRCSFLPICWGGCPKKHLEGDDHALAEQGDYWRRNLARLVTQNLGIGEVDQPFSERDQFREQPYSPTCGGARN